MSVLFLLLFSLPPSNPEFREIQRQWHSKWAKPQPSLFVIQNEQGMKEWAKLYCPDLVPEKDPLGRPFRLPTKDAPPPITSKEYIHIVLMAGAQSFSPARTISVSSIEVRENTVTIHATFDDKSNVQVFDSPKSPWIMLIMKRKDLPREPHFVLRATVTHWIGPKTFN